MIAVVLCHSYCIVGVKIIIYGKTDKIIQIVLHQLLVTVPLTTASLACLTLYIGWIGIKYTEAELPRAS